MFLNNNDQPINVLIVSENLYHQYGVKCLVRESFSNAQTINFYCLDERIFSEYTCEYVEEIFRVGYSFIFSGAYAYSILNRKLKHSLVSIFSVDDSIEYIREKLKHHKVLGNAAVPLFHHRPKLSKRESYLYELVMRGYCDDEIAKLMCISKKTISSHRGNILRKLGYGNKNKMYLQELAFY